MSISNLPRRFPLAFYVLMALFCLVLFLRIGSLTIHNEFSLGYDARSYYAAATALRLGYSPYNETQWQQIPIDVVYSKYLYTPLLAFLLIPLSYFPILPATYVCVFLSAVSAALFVLLMKRSVGWKLGLFAVFAFPPTWHTLYLGQINFVIACLLLLAIYNIQSNQQYRLGINLAFATLLKITPLFSTGMMFIRGYKRSILSWLMSISIIVLVTLPFVSISTWLESSYYAISQVWTFPNMLSWTGFFVHHIPRYGGILSLILSAVLLIYTLMRIRKIPPVLVLSAAILLPLLIVRIVWEHHAVMALPALLILWNHSSSSRLVAGISWLAIALFGGIAMPIALTLCWVVSCWPECWESLLKKIGNDNLVTF